MSDESDRMATARKKEAWSRAFRAGWIISRE